MRPACLSSPHEFKDLRRTRQAAHMGRQNSVGTVFHLLLLLPGEPRLPRITPVPVYAPANSSNDGSGMPSVQVGSRNSSRLPLGSKKYSSRPVNTPRARYVK